MDRFSFAALLLEEQRIASVLAYDSIFEKLFQCSAENLLGKSGSLLFPRILSGPSSGTVHVSGHWIQYSLRSLSGNRQLILLVIQHFNSDELYQFTLDLMDVGVQIYSGDSTLIFLNAASEEMSNVKRRDVLGKHLTSIYDTDEDQSTVLATLSTHTAVYNKADCFKTSNGDQVTVLNTAIPFFDRKGALDAVINLEYSQRSIERMVSTTQIMQKIIPGEKKKSPNKQRYYRFDDIVGHSSSLKEAINLAKMVAAQNSSVFISGETGTGKELFAQSIFTASNSRNFISVNCGTITEGLADATLFGTTKGAFTGSVNSDGLFAAADGGILFLDEINSLALSTQARLLRVLQEGTYMKVGAVKESTCNVRVLASCNQDPWELMKAGKLRQDLFYRIATSVIKVPPLRERMDDLDELANYFLKYYSHKFYKHVYSVSEDAMSLMRRYTWPGNIRELKNVMEFAVNAVSGTIIETHHLPSYIQSRLQYTQGEYLPKSMLETYTTQTNLSEQLEHYERELIEKDLQHSQYNISKAAESLGVSRQALQYKLTKYQFKSF